MGMAMVAAHNGKPPFVRGFLCIVISILLRSMQGSNLMLRPIFGHGALVWLGSYVPTWTREQSPKEGLGFGMLDRVLNKHFHAVSERVLTRYGDAQLTINGLCIEGRTVRHLHRASAVINGDGQCVIANNLNGGELSSGRQGDIASGDEKHISVNDIIGLYRGRMPGAGQGPNPFAAFEDTGGFPLKAGDVRQVTVELQNLARQHDLIALTKVICV